MKRRRAAVVALAFLAAPACERVEPARLTTHAEFGVLFGGQIQERRDIPFELDRAKQTQGFHVTFDPPLASDVEVEWRIDRPALAGAARKRTGAGGAPAEGARVTTGKAVARAGQTELGQNLTFEPGDPLGLWNVRVVVDGKVAIDRPFEVYDREARERASERDGGR